MTSWRQIQIAPKGPGFVIEQDQRLIDFINSHDIVPVMFIGEVDVGYFQQLLPQCKFGQSAGLLAIVVNDLYSKMETVLTHLSEQICQHQPQWVYIAINKYLITTEQSWPNLTDDLDADILNIVATHLQSDYSEIARYSVTNDIGKNFNFAHPTTNAYYGRNQ